MPKVSPLRKIFQKNLEGPEAAKGSAREAAPADRLIRISWTMATILCVILLASVAWAFFMGFMVGRGQNPEAHIQAITGIFGEGKENAAQPAPALNEQEGPAVKAEPEMAEKAAPQAEAARPFAKPRGAEQAAWREDGKPAPAAARKKAPQAKAAKAKEEAKPQKKGQGPVYDYLFQAAAYKNQKDAENMRKKIAAAGYRASLRKSGKAWLAIVSLRGNADDVAALRQKLRGLRLGEPLRLSRKEVAPRNQKVAGAKKK